MAVTALGWSHRQDSDGLRRYRAMIELARVGWGKDNPVFRQLFTSLFVPEARPEQIALVQRTVPAHDHAGNGRAVTHRASRNQRVAPYCPRFRCPRSSLHARNDEVVPFSAGKMLATEIPNAEFVELDSRNHILLADEPAWARFQEVVLDFAGRLGRRQAPRIRCSPRCPTREREILAALVAGRSNSEIGAALFISDKTVRNSPDPDLREARRAHAYAGRRAGT